MRVGFSCSEDELEWAGVSCSEDEPCPIYLELSSVAPNGRRIFLSGNLHSTSATLSSVLLASEDGGASWKEPAARIRGAALDQLQFYDLQHGWAAGETQYPLARDPFFYVTSDGGQSWRKRPVGEEGAAGMVQRFWFDSAQHGDLVIDAGKSGGSGRYLSFESRTGGESWNIQGTSDQLPKIRNAPLDPENAGFRLRSSNDGKAWQLEKSSGENWSPAATFLVEIANCKPAARELKEPEAPEPPADTGTFKLPPPRKGSRN